MKPNPPISKLLKHIKQQGNAEKILRQQGCPKSAFVRYSVQHAVIKSTCAVVVCCDVFYIQVNVLFILGF
jgi:predicted secreted protein